jgi:uncharacterized protein YneR
VRENNNVYEKYLLLQSKGRKTMNIYVTDEAAQWYKTELGLQEGDHLRFFVRYGGFSTVQSGFSLGVDTAEPDEVGAQICVAGITFFIESRDLWYFAEHDFHVSFNSSWNEPIFEYHQSK